MDITAETTIERDRDEVAAYMTDPSNDPEWIGGIEESRLLGDPPLGLGSRVARVASFLGRRVEYVNEVVALEPGRLEMHSVSAPFPMRITYSFEPDGGRTRVRNRVEGEPSRFVWFARPVIARLVRRNVQRDLARLRALLEAGRP